MLFGWVARVGCGAPFAPDTKNARMRQINAAVTIKPIKALHHIIRFAGAELVTFARDNACAIVPRGQRGHGPEPGFFAGAEGFCLAEGGKAGAVMGFLCCDHGGNLAFWLCNVVRITVKIAIIKRKKEN